METNGYPWVLIGRFSADTPVLERFLLTHWELKAFPYEQVLILGEKN